ncbi:hypothetical protein INR49_018118 [Caranx melampygus]|nr:hypothetical protein INR49_018118 [Caranx melampygus]
MTVSGTHPAFPSAPAVRAKAEKAVTDVYPCEDRRATSLSNSELGVKKRKKKKKKTAPVSARERASQQVQTANTLTCLTHSAPEPLMGALYRSWLVQPLKQAPGSEVAKYYNLQAFIIPGESCWVGRINEEVHSTLVSGMLSMTATNKRDRALCATLLSALNFVKLVTNLNSCSLSTSNRTEGPGLPTAAEAVTRWHTTAMIFREKIERQESGGGVGAGRCGGNSGERLTALGRWGWRENRKEVSSAMSGAVGTSCGKSQTGLPF